MDSFSAVADFLVYLWNCQTTSFVMLLLLMTVYDRQVSSQFCLSLLHYGTVIANYHRR